MKKILFADDDLKYSLLLKRFLHENGYDVTYVGNGKMALEQFPQVRPDIVLLDINMPQVDGYEVARQIRAKDSQVLIFFLTDRTEKNDRLEGFRLKANDYIAKPFYPEELLARIEERLNSKTAAVTEEEVYRFGNTVFTYSNNELRTPSSRLLVTSRQADILRILAQNAGHIVPRETVENIVWGNVSYQNSLALNVQVSYLRRALSHDATVTIASVKKKGLMLEVHNDDWHPSPQAARQVPQTAQTGFQTLRYSISAVVRKPSIMSKSCHANLMSRIGRSVVSKRAAACASSVMRFSTLSSAAKEFPIISLFIFSNCSLPSASVLNIMPPMPLRMPLSGQPLHSRANSPGPSLSALAVKSSAGVSIDRLTDILTSVAKSFTLRVRCCSNSLWPFSSMRRTASRYIFSRFLRLRSSLFPNLKDSSRYRLRSSL